jgi:hypothetical protein
MSGSFDLEGFGFLDVGFCPKKKLPIENACMKDYHF